MLYRCNNCDWETDELEDVDPEICDLHERVLPGDIMPQGVCPECRCFVHCYDPDFLEKMAAPELLSALKTLMPANEAAHKAMVRIGMTDAIIAPARAAIARATCEGVAR